MQKRPGLLIAICFLAMTGLLAMQAYWIVKHYYVTMVNFEKEVDIAFEESVKKEKSLRWDKVQQLIERKILDTNAFVLTGKMDEKKQQYSYTLSTKGKPKDISDFSFTFGDLSKSYEKGDLALKREVASRIAKSLRRFGQDSYMVIYRTQSLGKYMSDQMEKHQFDTLSLRKVFNHSLRERGIDIPYAFLTLKTDSIGAAEAALLTKKYPVITRSFATYRSDNASYVRAMFGNPIAYILTNLKLIFFSSFAMITLIAGCMIFILKSLLRHKRLSAIKNDFISNITHEFKTPIATVSVAIEALNDRHVAHDEEKRLRYLSHARNEINRLNDLVDKVLNLSVQEVHQASIHPEDIDVDLALNELIDLHRLSNDKEVTILYINNSGKKFLRADKIQFQHALNNILDNAIKYSLKEVVININVSLKDRFMVISIADNGIGIQEKDLKLVFEKFYRVGTGNSHPVKGYGLGLNYVQQIMDDHGGWYKIESQLNQGTTLTLGWQYA